MKEQDPYLIRDFVEDFDAIAGKFAARSRELSLRATMRTDIAYGARPRETLDLLFPENASTNAPLHVFVHGGYWRSGEKANYRFVAETPLSAGAITALVEYDLMPGQRLDVLVNQVRLALSWLHDNAASFGADPDRITASGHSAGAHLSSFLAASGPKETSRELPDVKGLLLLSGIYDLSGIPDSFLKDEAAMTHEEAATWSPLSSTQHHGPRRIIAYGGNETAPFLEQAKALAAMPETGGRRPQLIEVPDRNHMSVVLDLADPKSNLGSALVELIETT
ncbi:alpha/beta hydrolase [Aerobium aerolatum]|uniref:Arylformamidase n=1 Tax=Aquamicrobium aerolatum DSM 21857 TaxID=1121003 RepID=A0A1I3R3Q7_9HYPH|nr:alpha/beta hydrolase [Aquamicrobium aerolatum]SFJ41233.1 arylformamidase [Aquamicrobium aerolatum DSM 21857]